MELTIVIALLVIIAAILIPTFFLTTETARLRADIQSSRVIQNALDLYRIERGRAVSGDTVQARLQNLAAAGYIRERNMTIQTAGAVWEMLPAVGVVVNISDSPDEVHRAYANLTDDERRYIRGGTTATDAP